MSLKLCLSVYIMESNHLSTHNNRNKRKQQKLMHKEINEFTWLIWDSVTSSDVSFLNIILSGVSEWVLTAYLFNIP